MPAIHNQKLSYKDPILGIKFNIDSNNMHKTLKQLRETPYFTDYMYFNVSEIKIHHIV